MFWGKKEDRKSLPDLPPLKHPLILSSGAIGVEEKHELPSFPDKYNEKGFSQAAIKGAVEESSNMGSNMGVERHVPEFPSPSDNKFKTIEMEEWKPGFEEKEDEESHEGVPEFPYERGRDIGLIRGGFEKRSMEAPKSDRNADIFVKLDKFYSARKSLVDVQQNLEDIDSLLRKIREIKMREEQELQGWEKELEGVKARLNDVNMNLFEKVD